MYGWGDVGASKKTLKEILVMQKTTSHPSSACGKYQFIYKTLKELSEKFQTPKDALFDRELQDKYATKLVKRRGLDRFLSGHLTTEQFILSLSKEWASLPKDKSGKSYYAGDGLNVAHAPYASLHKILTNIRDNCVA